MDVKLTDSEVKYVEEAYKTSAFLRHQEVPYIVFITLMKLVELSSSDFEAIGCFNHYHVTVGIASCVEFIANLITLQFGNPGNRIPDELP